MVQDMDNEQNYKIQSIDDKSNQSQDQDTNGMKQCESDKDQPNKRVKQDMIQDMKQDMQNHLYQSTIEQEKQISDKCSILFRTSEITKTFNIRNVYNYLGCLDLLDYVTTIELKKNKEEGMIEWEVVIDLKEKNISQQIHDFNKNIIQSELIKIDSVPVDLQLVYHGFQKDQQYNEQLVFNPLNQNNLNDPDIRTKALSNIFIKDLNKRIEEQHLFDFFSQFGEIVQIWMSHEETYQLYFAYIQYQNKEMAENCLINCSNTPFLIEDCQPSVSLFLQREIKSINNQNDKNNSKLQQIQPQNIFMNLKPPQQQNQNYNMYNIPPFGNSITPVNPPIIHNKSLPISQINMLLESQNRSLYVKNLPPYLSEEQLKVQLLQIFNKFGNLLSVMIKIDPNLKRPYAFVNFEYYEQAEQALRITHGQDLLNTGLPLFVSWAERKTDRMERIKQQQNIVLPIMQPNIINQYEHQ